jgi:cytochrome c oxidase assembly protein subunit 11
MQSKQQSPASALVDGRKSSAEHASRRKQRTAALLAALVLGMVGLSFAAVPLYRLFCQVTGYGGTTQVAEAAPSQSARRVTVRFDANVTGMPWVFDAPKPVELALGETGLVAYKGRNPTARPILGTATYNVVPQQAGAYFNKIQCFCFTEQVLQPGQEINMPVLYYVDPSIRSDPDAAPVEQITLSYTFHRSDTDG